MLSTKDFLVEAKNKILTYGWYQGEYGSEERGFCTAGAMSAVQSELLESGADEEETYRAFRGADSALSKTLGDTGRITNYVAWNDASQRTEQEVLDLFDAAASRVSGE